MIAIHNDVHGNNFSYEWVEYCKKNNITYKLVSCYDNDILDQLKGCDALLWNIHNFRYRDQIMGKYLMMALEGSDINVFPDFRTVWHYDDKVAQKYLLEASESPLVDTFVFYDKKTAYKWIDAAKFPKVFKLRKGSGSRNVILVKNKKHARKLIRKAFGKGFPVLDMKSIFQERYRKYKLGKESLMGLFKGFLRIFIGMTFSKMIPREKGYIYFQEFLPNNDFDQRIIVIGDRAFALKRMVRENDFRASGSGIFYYDREEFDIECVKMAFEINKKAKFQCMTYDFIYDKARNPKIAEVSYSFNPPVYNDCPGYWDSELNWHIGKVNFEAWILNNLIGCNTNV